MNFDQNVGYTRISIYIRREADNFSTWTYISSISESSGTQWQQAASCARMAT